MPLEALVPELWKAFWDTLYMVGISLLAAIIAGLPLGVLLFVTDRGLFWENKPLQTILGFLINIVRSIPFIILLVALLPLTKWLVGTTIGPTAAAVSLSVAATPFFARIVETALREVDKGVIEAATAVGATPWMIIKDVLLSDALPGIVHGLTITAISLIGYSAMAGIVGGGGVGDLAIRFGYYRYDNTVMITTIIILLCFVQIVQFAGDSLARWIDKR